MYIDTVIENKKVPRGYKNPLKGTLSEDFWSEWRDSNSRHPGPKPGALPTGPHPDIKLLKNARCGQICGQGNSTTFSKNFQRRYLRGNQVITGEYATFGAVELF